VADLDDGPVVVLVVEDETLVRLLANDILSEAGYRVLEARDGQEALTILEVHDDVGALFTDVNMPHVDGLSLAKIVTERWPQIGVVIASGVADAPEGFRFLRKPYDSQAVLEAIRAAVTQTAGSAGGSH
jgi:CheY-like chemotaxis protein